jgi:hypothetical protein
MARDLTTKTEKLLTWLRMWGAMRGFLPLTTSIVLCVALLESFTPPLARFFAPVPVNLIHVFAIGIGLLLGVIGYFAGDTWDVLFEMFYGARGKWAGRMQRPLFVFPTGTRIEQHRRQAERALAHERDAPEGIYRDAVKLAKRQAERWEDIEHPLILSRLLRGLIWPSVFAAILALAGAAVFPLVGASTEAPRLLGTAAGCLVLALVLLVLYSHQRARHMIRLYEDVALHAAKRRHDRR